MSAQRARSAVGADHRSAHPNVPGVPWWGAVLIAGIFIAIGFAFDAGSGSHELGLVFAAAYVIGCLLAVLAVRQVAIFTAVIQPPLLLFVSVPASYFLLTRGEGTGLKDILINCGYPLIERFPLMFFTSAIVLIIGMARWYLGMSSRRATPRASTSDAEADSSIASAVTSKVSSLLNRGDDAEVEEQPRPRKRTSGALGRKPAKRAAPSRARHTRPPETDVFEPVAERPRRSRSSGRETETPVPPSEPRRRPRPSSNGRRATPPSERRSAYDRPERRRRYDDYPPLEPHGSNGSNGTHHPISRVRYRGGTDDSDDRVEHRSRRRTTRDWEPENWEYDV